MHRSVDELTLPEFCQVHGLGIPGDIQSAWIPHRDAACGKSIEKVSIEDGLVLGFQNDLIALETFGNRRLGPLGKVLPKGSDLMIRMSIIDRLQDACPIGKACGHPSSRPVLGRFEHVPSEPLWAKSLGHREHIDGLDSRGALVAEGMALCAGESFVSGQESSRGERSNFRFIGGLGHGVLCGSIGLLPVLGEPLSGRTVFGHTDEHVGTMASPFGEDSVQIVVGEFITHTGQTRWQSSFVSHLRDGGSESIELIGFWASPIVALMASDAIEFRERVL